MNAPSPWLKLGTVDGKENFNLMFSITLLVVKWQLRNYENTHSI